MSLDPIIKRALLDTITDIGQLTPAERQTLNRAVKRGWLAKGKGGPYPILKTVYAHSGFDFAAHRAQHVAEMKFLHSMDRMLGVHLFFPPVPFQEIK